MWEYNITKYEPSEPFSSSFKVSADLVAELNVESRQGWELVSVIQNCKSPDESSPMEILCFWKRQRKET